MFEGVDIQGVYGAELFNYDFYKYRNININNH